MGSTGAEVKKNARLGCAVLLAGPVAVVAGLVFIRAMSENLGQTAWCQLWLTREVTAECLARATRAPVVTSNPTAIWSASAPTLALGDGGMHVVRAGQRYDRGSSSLMLHPPWTYEAHSGWYVWVETSPTVFNDSASRDEWIAAGAAVREMTDAIQRECGVPTSAPTKCGDPSESQRR